MQGEIYKNNMYTTSKNEANHRDPYNPAYWQL